MNVDSNVTLGFSDKTTSSVPADNWKIIRLEILWVDTK